jgi:hypothetical protein
MAKCCIYQTRIDEDDSDDKTCGRLILRYKRPTDITLQDKIQRPADEQMTEAWDPLRCLFLVTNLMI